MPEYKQIDQRNQFNPLLPFIGFVVLLAGGALSWYLAPRVRYWLTSRPIRLDALGSIQLSFPAAWPTTVSNLVMALILFGVIFAIFIVVVAIVQGSDLPREQRLARDLAIKEQRKRRKRRR